MKIIYISIFCIEVMLAITCNKEKKSTLRSQYPAKYITDPSKLDMIYSLKAVDKKEKNRERFYEETFDQTCKL